MKCPKCERTSGDDWSHCVGFCPMNPAKPARYHTIRPGEYVRFDVPNRLYGATITPEGDAI